MGAKVDKQLIAQRALTRVEEVRKAAGLHRDRWPEIVGMNGIGERWLRAFSAGQIAAPPAQRFLALERWLVANALLHQRI